MGILFLHFYRKNKFLFFFIFFRKCFQFILIGKNPYLIVKTLIIADGKGHSCHCGICYQHLVQILLQFLQGEAGENLGFLPGDLQSKIDPYLRPLYDALYQIMGADSFIKNSEKGLIEVAPLAYMRGRTLDNAFIILDEAQNTTPAQMKMFLTRIGFGSKVVITGDLSQKDLPFSTQSGLEQALKVLKDVDEIGVSYLTNKDVVRHPLVQKIVHAYEKFEAREQYREKRKNEHKRK